MTGAALCGYHFRAALLRVFGLVFLLSVFAAAHSIALAAPPVELRVGGIYGLTGPLVEFSTQCKNGALLAADDVNAAGKVKLTVIFEDSRWEAKTALSAFNKLADLDHVQAVHVAGTSTAFAIKPVSESRGVILFSAGSHPDIVPHSRLVLRHSNRADVDAQILADAVAKEKAKKLAGIFVENDWGVAFDRDFKMYLTEYRGGDFSSEAHLPEQTDFRAVLARLIAGKPEIFMVNSFGAAIGLIIKQLRELGFSGRIYANNGLALSPDAQKILADHKISGLFYQTYAEPAKDFAEAYQKRFGEKAGIFSQFAYTDYELLAYAAGQVGTDPAKMAAFIKGLGRFKGKYQTIEIDASGDILERTVVRAWP